MEEVTLLVPALLFPEGSAAVVNTFLTGRPSFAMLPSSKWRERGREGERERVCVLKCWYCDGILDKLASVQSAEHHEAVHPRCFAQVQLWFQFVLRLWCSHPVKWKWHGKDEKRWDGVGRREREKEMDSEERKKEGVYPTDLLGSADQQIILPYKWFQQKVKNGQTVWCLHSLRNDLVRNFGPARPHPWFRQERPRQKQTYLLGLWMAFETT